MNLISASFNQDPKTNTKPQYDINKGPAGSQLHGWARNLILTILFSFLSTIFQCTL